MKKGGAPFATDPKVESSLRHSIKDGVYFSMMTGGAESYFSAYGIFLQLSTSMIGLLASLPPLLASLMQIASAWLGRKIGRRRPIIVGGALLQAASLLPMCAIPKLPADLQGPALIAIVFIYLCGPNIGAPQWNSLVGDLLPEQRRGRFFATRTRYASIASLAALVVAGLVVDTFDRLDQTHWGFVCIFAGAILARCASAYHLAAMSDPGGHVASLAVPDDLTLWHRIRRSKLLRFSFFFATMQAAVAISGPYFTLYMLRDLGLSYVEFMVITFASVLTQFLTLNRWGRLSDLFGNRLLLTTTAILITVIPAMWLISTNYVWLLAVQMLSGLCWAGFTLSATTFVFDLTPPDRRQILFAAHNVLAAIGVFLGAGMGAILVAYVPAEISLGATSVSIATPLLGLFFVSCLARIMVVLLFVRTLKEVRRVRPMSMTGLIFRVTRMHPVSGLFYELVARGRRDSQRQSSPEEPDGD
ncbi:MAG: MFS transporter [Pseudomonadales bacterium]